MLEYGNMAACVFKEIHIKKSISSDEKLQSQQSTSGPATAPSILGVSDFCFG